MNPQSMPTSIIMTITITMTMVTSPNKMMRMKLLPSLGSFES